MKDWKRPPFDNIGGIISFEFVPVEDVLSIDFPVNHRITKPVVLKAGKQWFTGYSTLGKIGYKEPDDRSPAGTIYKRSLQGFYPKDSAEIGEDFNRMRSGQFIIAYKDSNYLKKLIGSIDEPLYFSSALDTGTDMPNINGHVFSFYGEGTHKAYVYDI